MAEQATPTPVPITRLHFELRELIFSHLMPDHKYLFAEFIHTEGHFGDRGNDDLGEPEAWQQTCRSLRLTCSMFSNSPVLKEALFYEVSIFNAPLSLQNLDAISLSPEVAAPSQSSVLPPTTHQQQM